MPHHLPTPHLIPLPTGVRLHARQWPGKGVPFLLVHGLSSNARTWDGVADELAKKGHPVVTVNLRGHGLSDKPDEGYDFGSVAADLASFIDVLDLDRPIVAGQSWGGNVVMELAARRPDLIRGIVGVDGGTINLGEAFARWEDCAAALAPPRLEGLRLSELATRIRANHPDWSEEGIAATLANFEHCPDGTVRPWLTFERHMTILKHLWQHRPPELYPNIEAPVLLVGALGGEPEWDERKRAAVGQAVDALPRGRAEFYQPADHDVHVQQPERLANLFTKALAERFFA